MLYMSKKFIYWKQIKDIITQGQKMMIFKEFLLINILPMLAFFIKFYFFAISYNFPIPVNF